MEKIENMNFYFEGEAPETPIQIDIRQGSTPEPKATTQSKGINEKGEIELPLKALMAKLPNFETSPICSVNMREGRITLTFNKDKSISQVFEGRMIENPELEPFRINKDPSFTRKEIQRLIKMNAHLIGINEARLILQKFNTFETKFEQIYVDNDDKKGNTENKMKSELKFVSGELPEFFMLNVPLFVGHDPVLLKLEVEVEVSNNQPIFALVCLEYQDTRNSQIKAVLNPLVSEMEKTEISPSLLIYKEN